MQYFNSVNEALKEIDFNKEQFIRFEGRGIMSGLNQTATKHNTYRITGVNEDGLKIKAYRCKGGLILPRINFNQECEVYSKSEWQKLSKLY